VSRQRCLVTRAVSGPCESCGRYPEPLHDSAAYRGYRPLPIERPAKAEITVGVLEEGEMATAVQPLAAAEGLVRLLDLATEIKFHEEQGQASAVTALEHKVEIGRRLIEARSRFRTVYSVLSSGSFCR
jgi:hypothetical protein